MLSCTITLKLHDAVPQTLVAVAVTFVLPIKKLDPLAGEYKTVGAGDPLTVAEYETTAKQLLSEVPVVISEGQVITGAVSTLKFEPELIVAERDVSVIGPVVATDGSTAVMVPELTIVNVAAVPLNATPVTLLRLVPFIVTVIPDPEHAEAGENEVMVKGIFVPVTETLSMAKLALAPPPEKSLPTHLRYTAG